MEVFMYIYIKSINMSNMNTNTNCNKLLTIIAKQCSKLRNGLTQYGYSQYQINCYLISLLQQSQYIPTIAPQSNQPTNPSSPPSKSFFELLTACIQKNRNNIQRYLGYIIRKLEIQLYQLEQYQINNTSGNIHLQPQADIQNRQQSIKQASTNQSSYYSQGNTSHSIFIHQSSQNMQYNQNNKYGRQRTLQQVQQHENRLKVSLNMMIQKTKMLREMLERQMLLSIQRQRQRGRTRFNKRRFGSFMF